MGNSNNHCSAHMECYVCSGYKEQAKIIDYLDRKISKVPIAQKHLYRMIPLCKGKPVEQRDIFPLGICARMQRKALKD